MSRTHKIQRARKLYKEIKEAEIHPILTNPKFAYQLNKCGVRHGNKRKGEALLKIKKRRAERKNKKALDKNLE